MFFHAGGVKRLCQNFFALVVNASSHYTDEEKRAAIELRTPDKNIQKINDPRWVMLTIKDPSSRAMVGSLEALLLANNQGERFGNIKWTLVHPEYRRQGIATQLKLQLESMLRESGCSGIITGIKDNNEASIAMNAALGISPDASIRASPGQKWYTKRF